MQQKVFDHALNLNLLQKGGPPGKVHINDLIEQVMTMNRRNT